MRVLYERVAGIDVHKDMIKVAIRSPGDKKWARKTEILEYRTFYGVLQQMAAGLRGRGVTHVVMEASGVYTEPVYHALCEQDFDQVVVVNPAHARALRGHKTDLLTELFDVSAGQSADYQRCGQRRPTQRTVPHGGGGTRLELIATESGHAVRYRLPAFSSLLLAAPAGNGRAAVETASDQLICLVF